MKLQELQEAKHHKFNIINWVYQSMNELTNYGKRTNAGEDRDPFTKHDHHSISIKSDRQREIYIRDLYREFGAAVEDTDAKCNFWFWSLDQEGKVDNSTWTKFYSRSEDDSWKGKNMFDLSITDCRDEYPNEVHDRTHNVVLAIRMFNGYEI